MRDRRLGLGLDALLGGTIVEPVPIPGVGDAPSGDLDHPVELDLQDLKPNPRQPRNVFDEEDLRSLADSIRQSGVLQPILVRRQNGGFEIVAGERRLRAAKIAGLTRVPVVVRDIDDQSLLQIALIENLQRRDLNAMEKARAFKQLLDLNGWTQDQAAQALGLGRPTVANFLRLLELPSDIQEAVSGGAITMGHARALLATSNVTYRMLLLKKIVADDLSVRAVEQLIAAQAKSGRKPVRAAREKDAYITDLEQKLGQFFGTKVGIDSSGKGGTITLQWYSNQHFGEILRKVGM